MKYLKKYENSNLLKNYQYLKEELTNFFKKEFPNEYKIKNNRLITKHENVKYFVFYINDTKIFEADLKNDNIKIYIRNYYKNDEDIDILIKYFINILLIPEKLSINSNYYIYTINDKNDIKKIVNNLNDNDFNLFKTTTKYNL